MTKRNVPELSLLSYVNGTNNDQAKFVDSLFTGIKDYGFINLVEHTVDQKEVDRAYNLIHEFFNLPASTKAGYVCKEGAGQRGYTAFGVEHAKDNPNPDLKEFWHVGRELRAAHPFEKYYPKNLWPVEIPEFKETMLKIYNSMDNASRILLEALGRALDVPNTYFSEMIRDGNSILRAIHYPATKNLDTKNSIRAAAHGDINLITLLVGATDSGLQLLDRDGTWLDVNSKPGHIVVDSGDMLSRITNEVIPATIHRVINPDNSASARFSMPFFVHPHPEATLECIASCRGAGPKYPPISSHEFLMQRLKDIGLMGYKG